MALQTFTAGQVLTAAQVTALQTNGFNQTVSTKTASHVLVAADKGTRVEMNSASATTITVNTDLFNAGDTLFIQNIGAGVCTITAGTATVSTSGSLALIQNAGGTLFFVSAGVAIFHASGVTAAGGGGGLTFIAGGSFAAVTSFSLANDTFTSTFDNYKLVVQITALTADADFTGRLRVNGVDNTAAVYASAMLGTSYFGSASNLTIESQTSFNFGEQDNTLIRHFFSFDIIAPKLATLTFLAGHYNFINKAQTATIARVGNMQHASNTSFDSISFISSVASSMTGTFKVYGYANS